MGLIKIYDIDEFSEIKSIPDSAIHTAMLDYMRGLDEKLEIEQFIREILYDPNETPHGPTEIADILTDLHIKGNKKLAVFVIKGKSFKKVTSKDVTHQFAKLRQIPDIGLMVFGAVGNIQDDAQRDFIQTAVDANCDYLMIDVHDFCRLFIAYEKVCPKDGSPFDDMGICKKGHLKDEGLTLEMEVREKKQFTILRQRDVSHAAAKRYSAIILLDKHYPKDIIRAIIQEASDAIKITTYYHNQQMEKIWGNTPAHVVWLSIAYDLEDVQNANWVCQTCWIDSSLSNQLRPMFLNVNENLTENLGDIDISWNKNYKSYKNEFHKQFGSKSEVISAISSLLNPMVDLANEAITYFRKYQSEIISEDDFIQKMQSNAIRVNDLYLQSGNILFPPEDCKDFDQSCQNLFATIHNIYLYYSQKGIETWSKSKRDWLMLDKIRQFEDDMNTIEFEKRKIN